MHISQWFPALSLPLSGPLGILGDPELLGLPDLPQPVVRLSLATQGPRTTLTPGQPTDPACSTIVLADADLATLGNQAPVIIANALDRLLPGGCLVVWTSSYWRGQMRTPPQPGLQASELEHLLSERGLRIATLYAPGAWASLLTPPSPDEPSHPTDMQAMLVRDGEADRCPGLADAGEVIVGVAHKWEHADERSRHFFASLPLRTMAATTVCTHPQTGQVLIVFDTFKQAWTLPGGVVDVTESPEEGAIRETLEEAGVPVIITGLGGLFTDRYPDRLHYVYMAQPDTEAAILGAPKPTSDHLVQGAPDAASKAPGNGQDGWRLADYDHPRTLHPHEIGEVAWVSRDEALTRLHPFMADRLRTVLAQPGITWPATPSV